MTSAREETIRQHRLRQPLTELQRKSDKSTTRARLYTQEELDYADAEAEKIWRQLNSIAKEPTP